MDSLRLFILVIGLSIIAGIYLWGTLKGKKRDRETQRKRTIRDLPQQEQESFSVTTDMPEADIDYSGILSEISDSRTTQSPVPEGLPKQSEMPEKSPPITGNESVSITQSSLSFSSSPKTKFEKSEPEPESDAEQAKDRQDIVRLHVLSRAGESFHGQDIMTSCAEVDLRFGPMNIFHHYGVGEMKMDQALFNLANMIEPGSFDMNEIEDFQTSGLVLFLCLPTEFDSQLVFELMLNTARRLAVLLNGEVCDEQRRIIDDAKISQIRDTLGKV